MRGFLRSELPVETAVCYIFRGHKSLLRNRLERRQAFCSVSGWWWQAGLAPHVLPAIAHQRADLGFAGVAGIAHLAVFGGGGVEGEGEGVFGVPVFHEAVEEAAGEGVAAADAVDDIAEFEGLGLCQCSIAMVEGGAEREGVDGVGWCAWSRRCGGVSGRP